jgi:NAD(P)-dependent dehydrogenase (short-subunit alcohol dehydrogenase family)
MTRCYVVTGGACGIRCAGAERLTEDGHVVVVDIDDAALGWTQEHPRVTAAVGDADDDAAVARAADVAEESGTLVGWVNNGAVFRDAWLHELAPSEVLELITRNLGLVVAGCAAAVGRFLVRTTLDAIANVSSHVDGTLTVYQRQATSGRVDAQSWARDIRA